MKQSTAETHLRQMLFLMQKARSNAKDPLFGIIDEPGTPGLAITERTMAIMFPWLFGEKCAIPALVQILDSVDSTGNLAPHDYFNMMTILYLFLPTLVSMAPLLRMDLPPVAPDHLEYLGGWEVEARETAPIA